MHNQIVKYLWVLPLLLAAVIFCFTLNFPFQFDDYIHIVNNAGLIGFSDVLDATKVINPNFRSFTFLGFSVSYLLGGLNPMYYRIFSVLVHCANGFLLLYLIQTIFKYQSIVLQPWVKVLALAMFLLHPIQTQAVVYIAQQGTLWACFFYLLTIIFYLKGRKQLDNNKIVASFIYFFLMLVTLIVGMKSKQTVATSLLIIPLFEWLMFKSSKYRWVILAALILGGVLAVGAYLILGFSTTEVIGISRTDYLQTQVLVVTEYLKMIVLPINQSVDHWREIHTQTGNLTFWVLSFFHMALVFMAFWQLNKLPLVSLGILIFYFGLSIESSIFPIRDAMFEHRMYFPLIGIILVIAFYINQVNAKIAWITSLAILPVLSTASHFRLKVWQTDKLLWQDVLHTQPKNTRAYANLGTIYFNENKVDSALYYFEKAIELNPNHYESLNNLGLIYLRNNQPNVAIHYLSKSVSLNPKNEFALNNIGVCWEKQNALGQAILFYKKALKVNPYFQDALLNIAVAYEKIGDCRESVFYYKNLEKVNSNYPNLYFNLGNCLYKEGNLINAKSAYKKSIALDNPNVDNLCNLAVCFYALNEKDSAKIFMQKAYNMDTTRADVKKNLIYLTN